MNNLPWEATESDIDDDDDDSGEASEFDPVTMGLGALAMREFSRREHGKRPRSLPQIRGVQHAEVRTPAGDAKLSLPTSVAALSDVRRIAEEVRETSSEVDALTQSHRRLEKEVTKAFSKDRREASGDSWATFWVNLLDQSRDILQLLNNPVAATAEASITSIQSSVATMGLPRNKFGYIARFAPALVAIGRWQADARRVGARGAAAGRRPPPNATAALIAPIAGAAVGIGLSFLLKNRKR